MGNKTSADCKGYIIYLIQVKNTAVSSYLARLFNRCFEEQYFPGASKVAGVIPLLKSKK